MQIPVAESNRLEKLPFADIAKNIKSHIDYVKASIEKIENDIELLF